jgi:putative ABC transport system permease protein
MFRLARATVWFDRRRYAPIAAVVVIAGLMLLAQIAIANGIFRDSASSVERSSAQLWVGPEGAATLNDSMGLAPNRASVLWVIPELEKLEPFATGFGFLSLRPRTGDVPMFDDPGGGLRPVTIIYLDPAADAMLYARHMSSDLRARLREADTIVIGEEDARSLGVTVGDRVWLENRPLRLIGTMPGLLGLGASTVLVGKGGQAASQPPAFWLVGLTPGTSEARLSDIVDRMGPDLRLSILRPEVLSQATVTQFIVESGAGRIFMYSAGLAFVIAAMVVSQVMRAAVLGAIREYAALRAFGVSFARLCWLVLLQGGLIAAASVGVMGGMSFGLLALLEWATIPYALPPLLTILVFFSITAVLLLSIVLALRHLRQADPASLLR